MKLPCALFFRLVFCCCTRGLLLLWCVRGVVPRGRRKATRVRWTQSQQTSICVIYPSRIVCRLRFLFLFFVGAPFVFFVFGRRFPGRSSGVDLIGESFCNVYRDSVGWSPHRRFMRHLPKLCAAMVDYGFGPKNMQVRQCGNFSGESRTHNVRECDLFMRDERNTYFSENGSSGLWVRRAGCER